MVTGAPSCESNELRDNLFICPGCLSTEHSDELPYAGNAPGFVLKKIVKCGRCELFSMHPMPEDVELSDYYKTYWSNCDESVEVPMFAAQAGARYSYMEPMLPRVDRLRILDFGAGLGLTKQAFRFPTEYDAVEVDPKAVEYLQTNIRPRHVFSSGEEIHGQYHVVVLSHILEHLKSPLKLLKDLKNMLCEDGILFIEVPNKDFVYKARNEPHLIFFVPGTLVRLVEGVGYEVLKVDTCGQEISALRAAQNPALKLMKDFLKRVLPEALIRRIRKARVRNSVEAFRSHVSEYGGDRRWIRLIAVRR